MKSFKSRKLRSLIIHLVNSRDEVLGQESGGLENPESSFRVLSTLFEPLLAHLKLWTCLKSGHPKKVARQPSPATPQSDTFTPGAQRSPESGTRPAGQVPSIVSPVGPWAAPPPST